MWAELFPDEDFQFRFGLRPSDAAAFFASTSQHTEIVHERARWLESEPVQYSALLSEGDPLVSETVALAQQWNSLAELGNTAEPRGQLLTLRKSLEPDFLLLRTDDNGSFRLVAACVCFPSSSALEKKAGRPIAEIHAPAPTLNATLAAGIDQFLGRIRPDPAWARSNWGLNRSRALNQHPSQNTPRLSPPLRADEV